MKNVLMTNASSPLGEAIIKVFSAHETKLAITLPNPAPHHHLLAYQNTKIYQMPVGDKFMTGLVLKRISEEMGHIDLLINYVEITPCDSFNSMSEQKIDRHLSRNLLNPLHIIHSTLPLLVKGNSATIFNVFSSDVAPNALSVLEVSAMQGFSLALTQEMMGQNIHVETINGAGINPDLGGTDDPYLALAEHIFAESQKIREHLNATPTFK